MDWWPDCWWCPPPRPSTMDDIEARTAAFMAIWTADCIEFTDEFEPEPLSN